MATASSFGFSAAGLLRRRRRALRRGRADRLDLDLRERRTEAGLAPVSRLGPPLADPDLLAADVPDDLDGHGHTRREIALAVTAGEEHVGLEGLALVGREAVDEQALTLANAVLLAAE